MKTDSNRSRAEAALRKIRAAARPKLTRRPPDPLNAPFAWAVIEFYRDWPAQHDWPHHLRRRDSVKGASERASSALNQRLNRKITAGRLRNLHLEAERIWLPIPELRAECLFFFCLLMANRKKLGPGRTVVEYSFGEPYPQIRNIVAR